MTEPDDPGETTTHRKLRSTRRSKSLIWGLSATELAIIAISVVAAVGGALAPGRPTGTAFVDALFRIAFAGGLAFVTPRARRWTWLVLAGVAAAASGLDAGAVGAWVALAVALYAATTSRTRWLGAVVGGASVWALLRLPDLGPHGTTAVIVAAAVAPVLVSAYRRERRTVRRRVVQILVASGGFVVVAVVLAGVAGLTSVKAVDRGVNEARAGVAAAKASDTGATDQHLTAASGAFGEANSRLGGWMTMPARLVPVVGQQATALAVMSSTGRDLASLALDTTRHADYRGLAVDEGQVDVARIAALQEPLRTIDAGLKRAHDETDTVGADWLAAPLRDRFDELTDQITSTRDEVDVAGDAVTVAPDLLGANGPRQYFIAFTTPAESRGLGGFMGSWAVLSADHGHLELTRRGRVGDLIPQTGAAPRTVDAPADYLTRYAALHPELFPGDATFSPDFPSVAQALASIYAQVPGGGPVDGVLAVDPYGLGAMLEVTGPITVKGMDKPLSADNAADYLLREQYLNYDTTAERVDVLDEAAVATFDAFIHAGNLKPGRLIDVLAPAVAQRRIVAFSRAKAEQDFIEQIGLSGRFPAVGDGDFFAVVTQNGGNNKIDAYLTRSIDYRASYDPVTGKVDATATVTLRNDAPDNGLPDYVIKNRDSSGQPRGVNWTWFNFYSPLQLQGVAVDGQKAAVGAQRELGLNVYHKYVAVPSKGQAVVTVHLKGTIAPGDTYHLGWYQQPMTHPDSVTTYVSVSPPWYVDDAAAPAGTVPLISTEPQWSGTSSEDGERSIRLRQVS